MKERVDQHRAVTGGKQKAIAIFPLRIMRVMTQKARPENVSHRRRAERQTGMARLGFLDGVECQGTNGVDAQLIYWLLLHRRAHSFLCWFTKGTKQNTKGTKQDKSVRKSFVPFVFLCVAFVIIELVVEFLLACESFLVARVARHVTLEHPVDYELIFLHTCYFAHRLQRKQGSPAPRRLRGPAEQQRPP